MKKFHISVRKTTRQIIDIDAETPEEAIGKIREFGVHHEVEVLEHKFTVLNGTDTIYEIPNEA